MRRLLLSLLVAAALVPGAAMADPVKGGKIDVASKVGVGTRFTVMLPVKLPAAQPPPA